MILIIHFYDLFYPAKLAYADDNSWSLDTKVMTAVCVGATCVGVASFLYKIHKLKTENNVLNEENNLLNEEITSLKEINHGLVDSRVSELVIQQGLKKEIKLQKKEIYHLKQEFGEFKEFKEFVGIGNYHDLKMNFLFKNKIELPIMDVSQKHVFTFNLNKELNELLPKIIPENNQLDYSTAIWYEKLLNLLLDFAPITYTQHYFSRVSFLSSKVLPDLARVANTELFTAREHIDFYNQVSKEFPTVFDDSFGSIAYKLFFDYKAIKFRLKNFSKIDLNNNDNDNSALADSNDYIYTLSKDYLKTISDYLNFIHLDKITRNYSIADPSFVSNYLKFYEIDLENYCYLSREPWGFKTFTKKELELDLFNSIGKNRHCEEVTIDKLLILRSKFDSVFCDVSPQLMAYLTKDNEILIDALLQYSIL